MRVPIPALVMLFVSARSPAEEPVWRASIQPVRHQEPVKDEKKDVVPPLEKMPEPPPAPTRPPNIQGSPFSLGKAPLGLDEVFESVGRHYPLLRAIEEERAIAGGRLLSALGAFDTNLRASSGNIPLGTYENYRFSSGIEQPFTGSGITVFSQYRGGYGDFPIYYGERKTAQGGELRGGVSVPLLRDSEIDRRRASLQQAALNRDAAEPIINRQQIDIERAAARSYWNWVAAGERLRLAQQLAQLASERDRQLRELQQNKLLARIDRIDNQQNIAGRQTLLVEAQLRFQQAAIELSLFLRDDRGEPSIAGRERLPAFPVLAPVSPGEFDRELEAAFEQRPELQRLRLQRQALEVDLRLAQNQLQPTLNAFVVGSQDMGLGTPSSGPNRLDRSSLEAGFEFQLPFQRREAFGRVETARAQLRQLAAQEQFQRDAIRSEVQAAFASVERSYELHQQAARRVDLARQVADAERQRLKDGDSDVLRVTLREQAAFEAELIEVAAKLDYFRSVAEFKAAVGRIR